MAEFEKLNALLGEYAVPPASESSAPETKQSLHDLLGEYGNENTKALQIPKSHKSAATDIVHDIGIGTMQIPGAVTGLADIPAAIVGADRPFSRAAEKVGEITGFQPGKWVKEAEQTVYSPERQEAEKRVSEAWDEYDSGKTGIFSAIGKTLSEPRVVAGTVAKSLPSMAGGMGLARGAKALVPALAPEVAAGIGEGTVMAGQQMEQIDKSVAPEKAALASLATGVGGAALSTAGGKIAQKMGLTDIEAAAAGGSRAVSEASPLPFYKRIPGGAIQEGLLEEAPQSALEQAAQNIAEGKEISEGMGRAVTQGAIAGGVMGAGANILPAKQMPEASEETPSQEQAAQQQPAAPETQDIDQQPVTEDFAEVPTSAEQEPIIVPPEASQQAAYTEAEIAKLKTYVDGKTTASETAGRVSASPSLEKAAKQFGVYDESDDPATTLGKLRDIIYPAEKTDQEKIDEAGQQAREKLKDNIATQYDGKPMSVVGRAATLSIDQGLSEEEDAARKRKEEELAAAKLAAQQQEDLIDESTISRPLTAEDYRNRIMMRDAAEAERALATEEKDEFRETQDAINQQETGALYGDDSEQPGLLGDGERTAESGAGDPPEGQTDRNIPTTEEITTEPTIGEANGEGPDETAQTTSQKVIYAGFEIPPERLTEAENKLREEKVPPPKMDADYYVRGNIVQKLIDKGDIKRAYFTALKLRMPINFQEDEDSGTITMVPGGMFTESFRRDDRQSRQAHEAKEQKFRKQEGIKERMSGAKALALKAIEDRKAEASLAEEGITQKYPDETTSQEVTEAPIDKVAAQTEASKAKVSDAKEQEGEYPKASLVISGIPVSVENSGVTKYHPAGSERKGVDESGKEWSVMLKDHYGEIRGTEAADGDAVDVFIVPGTTDVNKVFIVDQMKVGPDGKQKGFDEHKIIFGAKNLAEARDVYRRNYSEDWNGLGAISIMPLDKFKQEWLTSDEAMKSPYSKKAADADAKARTTAPKVPRFKIAPRGKLTSRENLIYSSVAKKFGVPTAVVSDIAKSSVSDLESRNKEGIYPLNTARISEYGGTPRERYVEYVRRFEPDELTTSEAEDGIKTRQGSNYPQYLEWAKAGAQPPLISVSETENGNFQSSSRRRTLAAQEAGVAINGWFSPINQETRYKDPLKYGDILDAIAETDADLRSSDIRNTDDLLTTINKLGGISRASAEGIDPAAYNMSVGDGIVPVFRATGGRTLDDLYNVLNDYGWQFKDSEELNQAVSQAVKSGEKVYNAEGSVRQAEKDAREQVSDEENQARSDFLAEVDASNISQDDKDAFREDVLNGDFDPTRDYELLEKLKAEAETQEIDNIPGQFSRRAPMTQMDLFAESPGELTALQTKQQVAAYAAQKDKKRQGNGAEPPPLFSDYPGFMGQTDIEDTQASLEDTFKAMGKFDKAPETIDHPDAERIRYVQDNFLDLLTELESNNKVEIKC